MGQFLSNITQSSLFSLAGFLVGIAGIVLAVLFYRRTKRNKRFSFTHRSVPIFRDSEPLIAKLEVSYKGRETKNLTLTHLAFWNSGNETIRYIDLASTDPLRVTVSEGEILDSETLYVTQKANDVNLGSLSDGSVKVGIGFLDPQQGAVVRIVHTAKFGRHIDFKGTIMGAGQPTKISERVTDRVRRIMFFPRRLSFRKFKWILTFAVAIATIGFTFVLAMGSLFSTVSLQSKGLWRFSFLLILIPYWMVVVGSHRRQVPKELDEYLEEFGTEKKA